MLSATVGLRPAEAAGPATLGVTPWQVYVNNNIYPNPGSTSVHGHPTQFANAPAIPLPDSLSWANCGPGAPARNSPYSGPFSMCPNATTIGLGGGSILAGCWAQLNFTYFQSLVSIPEGTTISTFSVNMSGADDGAQIVLFNSAHPGGIVPPGGNIYQGTPQSTANLAPYVVAGEVNRVVIQQVDDCAVGNNLNSAQIFLNGTVVPPAPVDSTPPVITPTVVGTLGDNGWYTSDVNISFTVTDPDSTVTSTTGCGPTTVSADTAGQTFTCTATSAGGTASQSVTVKRDATAPTATATGNPAANGAGWNNADVTVSFTGTDAMSGVASCAAPVVLSTEGAGQSANGTCTDNAGNVSAPATATINIDKTAPTASAAAAPAPNGNGWNNTDVTVTFTGTDGLSGIASCTAPAVLGEGAGQSATGTCSDQAGNVSAPATASNINVDKTDPSVAVTGVADGASYVVGAVPSAGCDTTDALSGVAASAVATSVGGPLGSVTVTCAGPTDVAGNAAAAVSATYSVRYDFCGFKQPLLVPVQQFRAGSTIPVKFCVQDANGATVTTATGTVEAYVNGVLKGTVAFRFSDGQYIANVQTKDGKVNWPTGDLEFRVKLNDGSTHSTNALSTDGVKGGLKLR
ncbi:MAG: PxKF domain-containing protein [Chloroflexi bacterium]|nr:PxKF domain-containing protein [Chloroflexota bacterium]